MVYAPQLTFPYKYEWQNKRWHKTKQEGSHSILHLLLSSAYASRPKFGPDTRNQYRRAQSSKKEERMKSPVSFCFFFLSLFLLLVVAVPWESNHNIQAELKKKWRSLGIQYPFFFLFPLWFHSSLFSILFLQISLNLLLINECE